MNLKSTILTPQVFGLRQDLLAIGRGFGNLRPGRDDHTATLSSRDHNTTRTIRPSPRAGPATAPRALLVCRSLSPGRGLRVPHGDCPGRLVRCAPGRVPDTLAAAVVQSAQTPGVPGYAVGRCPSTSRCATFSAALPKGQKQVTLGFKRVEDLLGEPLPPSALDVRAVVAAAGGSSAGASTRTGRTRCSSGPGRRRAGRSRTSICCSRTSRFGGGETTRRCRCAALLPPSLSPRFLRGLRPPKSPARRGR